MPRELGTLVFCKVDQGVIQSPLRHAKLCKTQSYNLHSPASVFSSAGSFALQGQDRNLVSTGLLPTDCYQESKQSKIKNSALEEAGKIRGLTTLAYCKQDRLGCSWCMGNSLQPLEALANAVGNLRAQHRASWPRSQSACRQVKADSSHQSEAAD